MHWTSCSSMRCRGDFMKFKNLKKPMSYFQSKFFWSMLMVCHLKDSPVIIVPLRDSSSCIFFTNKYFQKIFDLFDLVATSCRHTRYNGRLVQISDEELDQSKSERNQSLVILEWNSIKMLLTPLRTWICESIHT